jgi:hypothetical protein
LAIAEIIAARWEMDLSPGKFMAPLIKFAEETFIVFYLIL